MGRRRSARLIPVLGLTLLLAAAGCQEPVRQAELPEVEAEPLVDYGGKYDLATVTIDELEGIAEGGKKLINSRVARSIIEFRYSTGFKRVEDLLSVPYVGEKTYLRIFKYFYVEEASGGKADPQRR